MRLRNSIKFVTSTVLLLVGASIANAQISFNNVTNNNLNPARPDIFVSESWGVSIGDLEGDHWPDVYVTNHRARPTYYRNNGDGTLIDNTLQVDLDGIFTSTRNDDRHGAAFSDFDGDGDHDLFSMQAGRGQSFRTHEPLFIVGPDGRFVDEGQTRGLPFFWGHSAYAFDVNGDGISDVVRGLGTGGNFSYLRQSANGNFGSYSSISNCGATWVNIADFDGDQIADMLCYQEGTFPKGAKSDFGNWGSDIGSIFPTVSNVVDGVAADFDNDLDTDVVLVRGASLPNQVAQVANDRFEASIDVGTANNEFQWTFNGGGVIEVKVHSHSSYDAIFGASGSKQSKSGAITTFTLDPGDPTTHGLDSNRDAGRNIYFGYDSANDEWTVIQHSSNWWYIYMEFQGDAALSNVNAVVGTNGMTSRDLPNQPRILSHQNGSFVDTTAASGMDVLVECGSVTTADFDNDMDIDIYAVCTRGVENIANRLFENQGDGTFTEVTGHGAEGAVGSGLASRVGQGESVGTADFDNDGFMDVFVVNGMNSQPVRIGGGPHEMILNNSSNSNHWVHLELRGTGGSDTNAVGARVVASAGGVDQLRYQDGGFHRWAQSHDRIHFGLGANSSVDLEIRWPDGQVENFPGVAADAVYVVTQGSGISPVTLTSPAGYPAPVAGDECGTPDFWTDRDQGVFVYKDCVSDSWKLRVTTGGQLVNMAWTGVLTSDQNISNVSGYSLEGGEVINNTSNPQEIDFSLTTFGGGDDGIDFTLAAGASGCLELSSPASTVPVLFGPEMLPISLPYDIANNTSCSPPVTPEISVTPLTVNENSGTADVEVTISAAPAAPVSVQAATIAGTALGGSDFYGRVVTLNFPAGQTTSQIFQVTLVDDTSVEPQENFQVRLFNPVGANVTQEFNDVLIDDDDTGAVSVSIVPITVNESDGVANIEVAISGAPSQPVSVYFATISDTAVGGTDFYGKSQVVSFASGQTQSQIVPVTIINDANIESQESFKIRLFNPNGASVSQAFTDIVVDDDDANAPVLPEFSVLTTSVNETSGQVTIEVGVNVAPPAAAAVKISTVVSGAANAATKGPGGDFYGSSATLNFAAGQTGNQVFTFTLIDDSAAEADEVVDIRLFQPSGGTIPVSFSPVTIIDDD